MLIVVTALTLPGVYLAKVLPERRRKQRDCQP
jgi:hypothetical protein